MEECCSDYKNISITIEQVENRCKHGIVQGKKFRMRDIIPDGLCVHAYNVAFPYCWTFLKKGWFLWVKKGDGVIAQCPNPSCSLVMKIKPSKENASIEVVQVRGRCPNKHSVGDKFILRPNNVQVCPEIFPAVYPVATELFYNTTSIECNNPRRVRVQTDAGEVTLVIKKDNYSKSHK